MLFVSFYKKDRVNQPDIKVFPNARKLFFSPCVIRHQVNSVSAREQLAQSIRDLTAALAERHASLTQALEAARQKRGEALAAQVAERRSLMEHAGLMAFTQELLKETDQPCFVQAARQTHNRFPFCLSLASRSVLIEQILLYIISVFLCLLSCLFLIS